MMKSVDLTVVDRCKYGQLPSYPMCDQHEHSQYCTGTGCAPTDLDVSPGAFDQLADPAKGRVDVTWAWLSPSPTTQG